MATGYSDLSNEVQATTELTPPEWVDIDTTVDDEIVLQFQRTDATDSGDITVYRSQTDGVLGSAIATLNFDATTYTDTTANVDDINYYTLRRDTGQVTADSPQANTLLPPPGITANTTKWDVDLSWSDAATTEVGYRVYKSEAGGAEELVADLDENSTTYESPRLVVDTSSSFVYRVEAYRQDFTGEETTASEDVSFSLTGITFAGDWTVIRPNASDDAGTPYIEDAAYDVDPVVDTANPFGDFGVAKIDDYGGEKFDLYPRGERVEFWRSDQPTPRLTGYVVERRETEQSGADALEVEAYSFDQFLRRNTVTNDQTGNLISEALADIIGTDTPVAYNAANINIGDDQELARSYQGVPVENALRDFAFKSNNEEFGVNDSLEFFFRPRETVHIDRGIDNTQWFNYDIPELGKQAINEVEVWFADGNESVIVDDGTDKLDLQDNLDLPEPGTQRKELQRPGITDINDAEDVGRKYLQFRNATLSGTVTTYGLFDAEPGDTIDITIGPRGIDEEFVIAATEYRWGRDQTILTIIEKRGETDGILTELNDSVQRVEMEGANRDAPSNRITTTQANAIVDVSVSADGNTHDGVKFVNDGRRAIRDGWADKGDVAISNIIVGDDGSGLSRSNTQLNNQVASATATESLPDSTTVEYSATITQTGVGEIGLEESDGTLFARATFATPVDLSGTVTVTATVSNDTSVSRGVLTNDGQTAVRDVIADNSPTLPTHYGYGSDGAAVSETDAALGSELVSVSLDEVLTQDANLESEWQAITDPPATEAVGVQGNAYGALQSADVRDDSDNDAQSISTTDESGDEYNEGFARSLIQSGDFLEFDITFPYDLPADRVGIQVRDETQASSTIEFKWNGTVMTTNTGFSFSLSWTDIAAGFYTGGTGYQGEVNEQLNAGETNTFRIEATGSSDYNLDAIAVYDTKYNYTFPNPGTENSGGALDGPQEYPDQVVDALNTATTRRNIDTASFTSTWNDITGNQYIEIANDGSTFTRFNNATSGSTTFASGNPGIDTNLSFGRFDDGSTDIPTTGNAGQQIEQWELVTNPDSVVTDNIGATLTRAIVPPDTSGIVNQTVREAGLKSGTTLLTRHELAEFVLEPNQRLASAETTLFKGPE